MDKRRRRSLLLCLLLIDVGTLALLTAWVLRRPPAAVGVKATSATVAPNDGTPAGGKVVAAPVPQVASSGADRKLTGGPKWATSAATDRTGTVWVGTEDQGVWAYQSGDNWQQFSVADGLADADATAIVADPLGRIWVGHPDHGLSVYNGQAWRAYGRFAGPGASHINCLATCPTDGDVWMGTDAGLARYALKQDRWTVYDRSSGLPAAQVTRMAFDSAGTLFAGLGAEGVGIARAADGYAKWTTVTGPEDLPIVASGPGLPSNLVNAVLVARDDTVYVGTCHGLARSVDHGATWTFVRGKDWPQLSKGRYDGVPEKFTGTPAGILSEDWVSALAEDPAGTLWVGFREAGFQTFPDPAAQANHTGKAKVTAIAFTPEGTGIVSTEGDGPVECGTTYAVPNAAAKPPEPTAPTDVFPSPAPAPTAAELDALRAQVEALPPGQDGIDYLGDDWGTQGDWCGRYGDRVRWVLGYNNYTADAPGYYLSGGTGPYRQSYQNGGAQGGPLVNTRGMLDPRDGSRIYSEVNDSSFNTNHHPRWQQGPDVFLIVTLPAGVHRVSIYQHNFDGHQGRNACRDYPMEAKRLGPDANADDVPNAISNAGPDDRGQASDYAWPHDALRDDLVAAELAPSAARTRASHFWRPVYKTFLVRGAGRYAFKIDHNGSPCTKANALFIDRLDQPRAYAPTYPHPPAAKDYTADPGVKGSAARLWAALDSAVGRQGYAGLADRARTAAYIAAAAGGVDVDTLANWRWQMPLWLGDDRAQFDAWVKTISRPAKGK